MPHSCPTFASFTAEMMAIYASTRAKKTTQKMRQVLTMTSRLPGVMTPGDLTPEVAAAFAVEAARGRHPNTAAALASYLRRACSYAVKRGYLDESPFTFWDGWVKFVPTRSPKVHPSEAIARVLGHLGSMSGESFAAGRLHAWATLLAFTGLRRDEALFLRGEDLDMPGRSLEVRRRLKRPTANRAVPINADLFAVLSAWLPRLDDDAGWLFPNRCGNPWSGGSPGYRPIDHLRRAGVAAGMTGLTPGSLRHSFATLCATTWNVPPASLQAIMGHTTIRTTMRYYVHLERAHLAEAALKFRYSA